MVDEAQKQEALRWIKQGLAALRAQDTKLAQRCLLKAKDLDPDNPDVWLYLTATTRDLEKRRLLLQKVLSIAPDHPQASRALQEIERQQAAAAPSAPAPAPAPAMEEERCPRCGAVMRYDEQRQAPVCIYCGYGVDGRETLAATRVFPEQPWPEGLTGRRCLSCDAVSLLPAGKPATTPCPVCMHDVLEPAEITMSFPDQMLMFGIDEARAAVALEDVELRGGLMRVLQRGRRMTRPRPALLPLWIFAGAGQFTAGLGAEVEQQTASFDRILIPAVRQLDPELIRVAEAMSFDEAVPCDASICQDREVFVLLPEVSFQSAVGEAHRLLIAALRRRARQATPNDIRRTTEIATRVHELTVRQVVVPVWVNEIRAGGQVYMGLVNGVTGDAAAGSLPRLGRS
ncbi:MAG: hypothetical protein JXN59_09200 [Anaerolineae bacterium]|nr:hypothetical protein [Anaerolineae bacterium]